MLERDEGKLPRMHKDFYKLSCIIKMMADKFQMRIHSLFCGTLFKKLPTAVFLPTLVGNI
jgi:hypothetical protein